MGDTFAPSQEGACLGRSVTSWTSGSGLWARLLEGEKMAPLCAAFGISRKTGYKIFERYKDCGIGAFTDRSRRPYRQGERVAAPMGAAVVRAERGCPGR